MGYMAAVSSTSRAQCCPPLLPQLVLFLKLIAAQVNPLLETMFSINVRVTCGVHTTNEQRQGTDAPGLPPWSAMPSVLIGARLDM